MNQFAHLRKGRLYQFRFRIQTTTKHALPLCKAPNEWLNPIGYVYNDSHVVYLEQAGDYLKVLVNDQVGWIPCIAEFRLKRVTCRMLRRAEQFNDDNSKAQV